MYQPNIKHEPVSCQNIKLTCKGKCAKDVFTRWQKIVIYNFQYRKTSDTVHNANVNYNVLTVC